MTDATMHWHLVVPLKPVLDAKSRLATQPRIKHELVRAFARDVVEACLTGAPDEDVVVVCDATWTGELPPGVRIVPDQGPDLNGALSAAAATFPRDDVVAVILGDLPCVTPEDIRRLLLVAGRELAGHESVVVPDADGTGTAVLISRAGVLRPAFGPGSRQAHRFPGSTELTGPRWRRIRRDVDELDDIARALALGVGAHTGRALMGAGLAKQEAGPIT